MQPRAKKLGVTPQDAAMPRAACIRSATAVVPPQEATIEGQPGAAREHPRAGQPRRARSNAVVLWIVADRLAQPEGACSVRAGRADGLRLSAADAPGRADLGFAAGVARPVPYSWSCRARTAVKACGSGISSRHDVGDTTMRPS